jgi:zinc-ribbon family
MRVHEVQCSVDSVESCGLQGDKWPTHLWVGASNFNKSPSNCRSTRRASNQPATVFWPSRCLRPTMRPRKGAHGMLILGTRWKAVTIGQLLYACSHCRKQTMHSTVVRRGKFTLFFIPLFPVGRKYFIVCNLCGLRLQATSDLLAQLQLWEKTGQFPSAESLAAHRFHANA